MSKSHLTSALALSLVACGSSAKVDDGGSGGDSSGDRQDARDAVSNPADARTDIPSSANDGATDGSDGDKGTGPPFTCITKWPQNPTIPKAAPLATQPRLLWKTPLPLGPLGPLLAAAGTGVAVARGDTLSIIDGDGNLAPPITQLPIISSPVAGKDGSVYFSDPTHAYGVSASGSPLWQAPTGSDPNTSGDPQALGIPALDPSGNLYINGQDGSLRQLRAQDGEVTATWPMTSFGAPHYISAGVADVVFIDMVGILPGALGAFSISTGQWVGQLTLGNGMYQPSVMVGFDIGIVEYGYLNVTTETTQVNVLDPCGRLRWSVPGSYAYPLVIGFDDELIIEDRVPTGGGTYARTLRRFSSTGTLLAGPAAIGAAYGAVVGADDTTYLLMCTPTGNMVVALDASLTTIWSLPLSEATCQADFVLNDAGKLFFVCNDGGTVSMCAVQTTSPGPAPVSWPRAVGRDARGTFWLAP